MPEPVLRAALGDRFERLHTTLRAQYDMDSTSAFAWVGRGMMEKVWRGGPHVRPFIWLGSTRRILFPRVGSDIPFTVTLIAYEDEAGRQCVTWLREFVFPDRRWRFDEVLVWNARRGNAVVLCGTHQHLAVDIAIDVDEASGELLLKTARQRVYAWSVRIAWPRLLSGDADVRAGVADDGTMTIDGGIANPLFGPIFGYRGTFTLERVSREEAERTPGWRPIHCNTRD